MRKVMMLMILITTGLSAQEINQRIFGHISDANSGEPLKGAYVIIESENLNTVSDEKGNFIILEVPVGRHIIKVTHTGYQTVNRQIVVKASRQVEMSVQLNPNTLVLEEVSISEDMFLSELNQGYGKNISIEQTNRIPANFFDPVRMATSFPGVIAANDQANNLVVRGHSPNTIQWKLEGMDILNPNHQANAGTLSDIPVSSGGGVNILSAQMLGNTSIVQGAAPVQYGNGLTTFDMSIRDGNSEQNWTGQASLIGLDLTVEGKAGKGNYLANYRYSTVGLLSHLLGIDFGGEEITFQDLSFNFTQQTGGVEWKVFGFGGQSRNHFNNAEEIAEQKDWYIIDYEGNTGAIGATARFSSGLELGIIHSATYQVRDSDAKPGTPVDGFQSEFLLNENLTSIKLSQKNRLSDGVILNYGFLINRLSSIFSLQDTTITYRKIRNSKFKYLLSQPYLQITAKFTPKWILQGGVRYFGDLVSAGIIEPRVKLDYLPNAKNLISMGYSLQSQRYQSTFYHSRVEHKNLEPAKFHLINALWERKWTNSIKSNVEFYGIKGIDLPASANDNDSLAWVNLIDEIPGYTFYNAGSSMNYGLEWIIEKALINDFYGLIGGSVYTSGYKNHEQLEYTSGRFDGGFSFHGTLGYEHYSTTAQHNRKLNINTRILYLGGMKSYRIETNESTIYRRTILDFTSGYSSQLDNYFRVDLGFSITKFKEGFSRSISLDIQNVLNVENDGFNYWDAFGGEILNKKQLGLIPVLSYRVEF